MQTVALLALLQYSFPTEPLDYRVQVHMEGFLPILGGNEGKVDADLSLRVVLKSNDKERAVTLIHEITGSKLKFDGEELPLGLDQVQEFFPKTNLQIDTTGKVLATDAPEKASAIRLPGLDSRRLADVTFLPLIFPAKKVSDGETWSFVKAFGASDVTYTCKIVELTDKLARIDISTAQTYTVLENEALEVVSSKADAVNEVTTTMTGKGQVLFSREREVVTKWAMITDSSRTAKELKTAKVTTSRLKSTFDIGLVEKKS